MLKLLENAMKSNPTPLGLAYSEPLLTRAEPVKIEIPNFGPLRERIASIEPIKQLASHVADYVLSSSYV